MWSAIESVPMRKVSLPTRQKEFVREAKRLRGLFHATNTDSLSLKRRRLMAELVFASVAVRWEVFISDYCIGSINRDASQCRRALRDAVRETVRNEHGDWAVGMVRSLKRHPSVAEIHNMLDPKSRNVTFSKYDDFRAFAREYLAPLIESKIKGLPPEDRRVIDATIKIRNYIAHRSKSSTSEVNHILNHADLRLVANRGLARGSNRINNAGAFLLASSGSWKSRLEGYVDRLLTISRKLV